MNAFCTVVTRSHLGFAKVLAETLLSSGNKEPLFVLIADCEDIEDEHIERYNFNPIYLSDLTTIYPPMMPYYYDAFEFCCALKPFLVNHLFDSCNVSSAIYLDCDIFVVGSFESVWEDLKTTSLLLTPHQLLPPPIDINYASELDVQRFGLFNGGFYGWRAGDDTQQILNWMCQRFTYLGFSNPEEKMFVDQNLLPLVLGYFSNFVRISRNLGLNIAYWNAHERNVKFFDGRWIIDGNPVVFFHMSGYRLTFPDLPCAYLNEQDNNHILRCAKWFEQVIIEYKEILLSSNKLGSKVKPYYFGELNGITLNKHYRRILFKTGYINQWSYKYWRIWLWEKLKAIKNRFRSLL